MIIFSRQQTSVEARYLSTAFVPALGSSTRPSVPCTWAWVCARCLQKATSKLTCTRSRRAFCSRRTPTLVLDGRWYPLMPGACGVVPVSVSHAWLGPVSGARWIDMLAPQPRMNGAVDDTFFLGPAATDDVEPFDIRDPRSRHLFRVDDRDIALEGLKAGAIDAPTVSASMSTALLAYSGIAVKMLVDHGSTLSCRRCSWWSINLVASPIRTISARRVLLLSRAKSKWSPTARPTCFGEGPLLDGGGLCARLLQRRAVPFAGSKRNRRSRRRDTPTDSTVTGLPETEACQRRCRPSTSCGWRQDHWVNPTTWSLPAGGKTR